MSTHTKILYQVVFSTKNRDTTLNNPERKKLYEFIWGVLKNNKCHLYRIGGIENHIHILFSLHQGVALSSLVKDIKLSSSDYILKNRLFKRFTGWQEGYGAFTYSDDSKEYLIEYIKNQEEHHRHKSFKEELIEMLEKNNIEYDMKYLF